MSRMTLNLIVLGILSAATQGNALGANIVVNGDFEAPVVVGFYYNIYSSGQSFAGWTVGQGSTALFTNQFNPGLSDRPYEGHQALQLSATQGNNGSIYQDLATIPGTAYIISFAFASNPFASETVTMQVGWGGETVANLSAVPSHDLSNSGWMIESFIINATQAVTRLEFLNTTSVPDIAGPQIDALTVTAVPEPLSIVMVGLGVIGAIGFNRVRRDVD